MPAKQTIKKTTKRTVKNRPKGHKVNKKAKVNSSVGSRIRRLLKLSTIRGRIVLYVVLFAVICAGYMTYQSFAATPVPAGTPTSFSHPGVLVNKDQINRVKAKIATGEEPWKSALARAQSSPSGQSSYQPRAYTTVICYASGEDHPSCKAEVEDALAAYTQALLWNYTGNKAHATAAIRILNAWSKLTLHTSQPNGTADPAGATGVIGVYANAAWAGDLFARAAELTKHTNAGWSDKDSAKFEAMLRTAFLPKLIDEAQTGANIRFSIASANTGIGVFLDDSTIFDRGVTQWRRTVPSTIYLDSDGAKPPVPANNPASRALRWCWNTDTECRTYAQSLGATYTNRNTLPRYTNGIQAETCRDAGHLAMGMAAMFDTAETAYIQGVDLYKEQQPRLVAALEYNSRMLRYSQGELTNAATKPSNWVCPPFSVDTSWGTGATRPTANTGDIAYNHYRGRIGLSLPYTAAFLREATELNRRPQSSAKLMQAWETLTHAYK
ncbi:MAG: alginate lyase family protein [Candidatus Saccharimonas sp.]